MAMKWAAAMILMASAAGLGAQSGPGVSAPGVTPVWELRKQLDALVAQTRRLAPLLEQVKPQEWGIEGYRQQHEETRAQVEYLARSAGALAQDPEKMTLALDAFLRLESLEQLLDSLSQGTRRYQNPALADLMQAAISDNAVHRSKLRGYLVELVATKQDELRAASEEAQSCRAAALAPPPPPAPSARRSSTASPPAVSAA
ncbi:MAG: hypothetical protein IT162_09220, partial [Bryobacterales bacterium]|nr:hypothetical protein [Bryobacterales bacterium]